MAELRVIQGPNAGQAAPLTGMLVIGRDPGCELVLADDQVSRRHVRVTPAADGATAEDLGSTNGTYVDGRLASGAEPLRPGARIQVGDTLIEYAEEAPTAPPPGATRVRDVG